jgi:hypothetical protein
MSDLENMAEMQNEVTQPDNVVATESEEVNQPQVNDEDTELYIETEGDQEEPKTNMSQEQAYAAFRKEKEKRQRKNEELQKEKEERERIQRELDELKSAVGSITKGAPPTLESCDYDEELYERKMQEYYAPAQAKPESQAKNEQQPVSNQANDMAEFYLYQKEQELSKQIPDYEQNKAELVEKMKQFGGSEQTIVHLAGIANQAGVDIAKANIALNKVPGLLMELNQAAATGNQFQVAEVLKKAASKVQTRQRKPLDTQPEPSINSSGPIDNHDKAAQKARDAWVNASPSERMQKWNEYQAVKRKVNK